MAEMRNYAPSKQGFRHPQDTGQRNGPMINPPRYLTFGGRGPTTALNLRPGSNKVGPAHNAVGPISDRGRGSRKSK